MNAPDGAGRSLAQWRGPVRGVGRRVVLMRLMVLGAPLGAQFPVAHTRDGITQHNTAHNGLILPLCANGVT